MEMLSLLFGCVLAAGALVTMMYFTNRSRQTLEEASALSRCSLTELQDLIRERLLDYRSRYFIFGPKTVNTHEIEQARVARAEIHRIRAETDAFLHQKAEEIREANRIYEEQLRIQQEMLEQTKRAYAEMLRQLGTHLNLIPPDVVAALRVLGLPADAPFDDVRRQYRLLAKRHHPDARGDAKTFIAINAAYTHILAWIQGEKQW